MVLLGKDKMKFKFSNIMLIVLITIMLTITINIKCGVASDFMNAGAGGAETYSYCEKRINEKVYLDYFRLFKKIFMSANQIDSETFDNSVKFNAVAKVTNNNFGTALILLFIITNGWFNEAETHQVIIPMLIPNDIPEKSNFTDIIGSIQKRNEYLTEEDIKEHVIKQHELDKYSKAIKGRMVFSSKKEALIKLATEMNLDSIVNRSKYDPREELYLGQPTLSKWIRVEGEKNHCREYKLNLFTSDTSFRDSPCAIY